jgi:glycosidase
MQVGRTSDPQRQDHMNFRPAQLLLALLLAASGCRSSSSPPPPPPPIPPGVDVTHVAAADPGSTLPATWSQGPFMEIYVRGYKDSDGDGVGDLKGLKDQLPYLADLGVTGLWLMPVNQSQDHDHGYAVTDYRAIETSYGAVADLDDLVTQAHLLGIGVIIDYVMNHSGSQNPLFNASAQDLPGGWRDWYVWSATHPVGWSVFGRDPWIGFLGAWFYGPFSTSMPDFNLLNPAVVEYHHDNLRFWLNRGVDGFRFDAVGMLVENGPGAWEDQPQNYALMGDVKTLVGTYQRRAMVCEDPAGSLTFDACGMAFDFALQPNLVGAAKGSTTSLANVASRFVGMAAGEAQRHATFLANHDSFTGGRVMDQVAGDEAGARLAAATLLLMPGTPFLYYGEEVGMSGAASLTGDWKIRTPMSWTGDTLRAGFTTGSPFRALSANVADHNVAAEAGVPGSLLSWYKALIALRRAQPELAAGDFTAPQTVGNLLVFRRSLGAAHALVLLNYGVADDVAAVAGLPASSALTGVFPAGLADAAVDSGGQANLPIPARSALVYTWTL